MKLNALQRAKAAFDAKDFATAIRLAHNAQQTSNKNIMNAAFHLLMISYTSIGDYKRAMWFYNFLIKATPHDHVFLVNAAILFKNQKKYDEAKHLIDKAIHVKPDYPDIYFVLGVILNEQGFNDQALRVYEKGMVLEHRNVILTNIGNTLEELGHREQAKEAHLKTLTTDPTQLEAYINLASIAVKERDYLYAETLYNNVIERDRNHGAARMGLAHLQLMRGDWQKGWENYRWRFISDNSARKFPWPEWLGNSVSMERLLIVFEQGYGDCFMAARWLKKFNPNLTMLNCPDDMQSVISHFAPNFRFIGKMSQKQLEAKFDTYIHIMDLFRLFQFDGKQPNISYIDAGTYRGCDPVIGYCWKGRQKPDPRRSIGFDQFKRLVLPVVDTVSLQLDATDTERRNFTRGITVAHDWVMTKCEIEQCNLIITIDTAIAHLAGAMGKQVWCLVPWSADWRYGMPSDNPYRLSQFYPFMRIYQQDKENDWTGVIERVRADLKRWLGLADLERPAVSMGILE